MRHGPNEHRNNDKEKASRNMAAATLCGNHLHYRGFGINYFSGTFLVLNLDTFLLWAQVPLCCFCCQSLRTYKVSSLKYIVLVAQAWRSLALLMLWQVTDERLFFRRGAVSLKKKKWTVNIKVWARDLKSSGSSSIKCSHEVSTAWAVHTHTKYKAGPCLWGQVLDRLANTRKQQLFFPPLS